MSLHTASVFIVPLVANHRQVRDLRFYLQFAHTVSLWDLRLCTQFAHTISQWVLRLCTEFAHTISQWVLRLCTQFAHTVGSMNVVVINGLSDEFLYVFYMYNPTQTMHY